MSGHSVTERELRPGLFASQPLPGVFQLRSTVGVEVCGTLLVGGSEALLVDTQLGFTDLAGAVREITELPLTVILTHGHIDHCCGCGAFPEVYADKADIDDARLQMGDANIRGRLLRMAAPNLPEAFSKEEWSAWRGENLRELRPGAGFELGGLSARTIPIRTHSPGSVCVFCPERELLLGGDAVSPMCCLAIPGACSVSEHLNALETLRELPFRHLLSGHSARLIPRDELETYIQCARSIDPKQSTRYRDPIFPEYPGLLYCCNSQGGAAAAIMYTMDRLS